MNCFKCQVKIDTFGRKIGFREQCEKCGFDLHVCKNCEYYIPGKPNDCHIPGTEPVKDRERFNFCEDFSPRKTPFKEEKKNLDDIAKKLFKD